jgi:lysophospholipase L1-like esterase
MSGGASRVPACQQHQLTRPRWVFFGDSITQRGSSEQTGWVSQIASVYQRRVDVINRGYSGYNTRWAKALMPHLRDTLYKAQCVTVFFGANDSALKDRTSHSQHVPILEFTSNLTSIVEELRELDVENIILVTPPPVSEPHRIKHAMDTYGITLEKGSERVNAVTQEYAQACERVGKEMGVPVVHLWNSIMESMPETFGDELLNDGLHLTEKGSQYVFQEVLGTIQSSFPALKVDEIPYDVPDCKELMVGDDQEAMRLLQQYLDGLSGGK